MHTLFLQALPHLTHAIAAMASRAGINNSALTERSRSWFARQIDNVLELKQSIASDAFRVIAPVASFLHHRSEVRRRFIRRRYHGGDASSF
jgi:hypothetical protein